MSLLKTVCLIFSLVLSFAALSFAQEKVIVIDDAFTRENDRFSIVLIPVKSSFKDNGPLAEEHILSAHTYEWHFHAGSLILMYDVFDKAFCSTIKEHARESQTIKDQLAKDANYELVSETSDSFEGFTVTKLKYRYQTGGKITFFFYENCGGEYWLYGWSKMSLADDQDPVVQAMNSFTIVK